jgi:triosephosphate isomerase
MPGNVDVVLFGTGFVVGAACVIMLGGSLAHEHDRRIVIPATIVGALIAGGILGWSLNYFFHFAQQTGP